MPALSFGGIACSVRAGASGPAPFVERRRACVVRQVRIDVVLERQHQHLARRVPSIVRLLAVAVSGGTPKSSAARPHPCCCCTAVSPSSLIVTRFPFVACGHDSASWFRIASWLPLFWIVIETCLAAGRLVRDRQLCRSPAAPADTAWPASCAGRSGSADRPLARLRAADGCERPDARSRSRARSACPASTSRRTCRGSSSR